MSHTPNIDALENLALGLLKILRDRQPGLPAWRTALHDRLVEMAQYSGDGPLLAAPDLLAAWEAMLPFLEEDFPDGKTEFVSWPYAAAYLKLRKVLAKAKGPA